MPLMFFSVLDVVGRIKVPAI